ncbi:hypothetical protein H112_05970 [Trichophyton rubrum D6]|uniref:Uncharacterized protein n=1 Tax=Trichophyton rubrum (strain ATCC MYA-4607 / CBS 118892) TaxID=559305 RepID=A0A080WG34_TRIRC|nr:uncharacterized protein TERG_12037 [Trichophyton rubrum CBS 118892]EZF40011.1 hypothetical protein H102_05954 [Trichophyton rubrum CBS 100081]EZF61099.1 hypothetical protein H104_05967 [Trichophyton rubrum CBS 289.86]KDB31743.1 hypothetical protein H112_05970 [Trichophyton rubrum D6]KFL61296.1 hypothetical protein TERG_12037 [Trichophyton rubrum CBS 118892]
MEEVGVSKDKHPAANPAVWHRVSLPPPSISILRGISAYPLAHPEGIRLCFASGFALLPALLCLSFVLFWLVGLFQGREQSSEGSTLTFEVLGTRCMSCMRKALDRRRHGRTQDVSDTEHRHKNCMSVRSM